MKDENLFIIIFERPSIMGCTDKEIRLCKASDFEHAINIARIHRDKFFKDWSISINHINWSADNTAYVYSDYK